MSDRNCSHHRVLESHGAGGCGRRFAKGVSLRPPSTASSGEDRRIRWPLFEPLLPHRAWLPAVAHRSARQCPTTAGRGAEQAVRRQVSTATAATVVPATAIARSVDRPHSLIGPRRVPGPQRHIVSNDFTLICTLGLINALSGMWPKHPLGRIENFSTTAPRRRLWISLLLSQVLWHNYKSPSRRCDPV